MFWCNTSRDGRDENRVVRMVVGLTVANGGTISTRIAVATRKKYAEQGRDRAEQDRILELR